MKIVLNRDFGGPGFYAEEFSEWCEENAPHFLKEDPDDHELFFNYDMENEISFRTSKELVRYVEEGRHKGTSMCDLVIIEVPDDVCDEKYYIHYYDGLETLHEKHMSW